ncbi:MAG: GNAT family N-acetyltransferase [Armatimonadota bacterium]|nr:GNAT family N-acetyltransferase [Armatimonadota bacterium]MDR7426292.1 GNAT family N-acetyltransferase [Armatimonadota bacterium]MDR7465205.1 GNAT family N-acetyltransferase [Armatimonadota bacterium]MDR7470866.1 GNAT family N-acetyltransferase [Armatimonadota bacterium]MDR7474711.1 GNAT family N-acetyltransferase [Armatimonadota bacterium]
MEIGPARPQDIDGILDLWGELATFHAQLDPAFTPAAGWRPAYAGYLSTLLGRPDARVLVAREQARIVGYGVARITLLPPFFAERRRGFIQDVFTRQGYRRRGIAHRLVTDLLTWLREEDVRTVELTVAINNTEAILLWKSLGFRPYMQHFKRGL